MKRLNRKSLVFALAVLLALLYAIDTILPVTRQYQGFTSAAKFSAPSWLGSQRYIVLIWGSKPSPRYAEISLEEWAVLGVDQPVTVTEEFGRLTGRRLGWHVIRYYKVAPVDESLGPTALLR